MSHQVTVGQSAGQHKFIENFWQCHKNARSICMLVEKDFPACNFVMTLDLFSYFLVPFASFCINFPLSSPKTSALQSIPYQFYQSIHSEGPSHSFITHSAYISMVLLINGFSVGFTCRYRGEGHLKKWQGNGRTSLLTMVLSRLHSHSCLLYCQKAIVLHLGLLAVVLTRLYLLKMQP